MRSKGSFWAGFGACLAMLLVGAGLLFGSAGTTRACLEDGRFPLVLAAVCGGQPLRDTSGRYTPLVIRTRAGLLGLVHDCNAAQTAYGAAHPDVFQYVRLRCGVEPAPQLDPELTGWTREQLLGLLERTIVRYLCLQLSTPEKVEAGLVAYRDYFAGLTKTPPMVTVVVRNLPVWEQLAIASPPAPAPTAPVAAHDVGNAAGYVTPAVVEVTNPTPTRPRRAAPVSHNVGVAPLGYRKKPTTPTPNLPQPAPAPVAAAPIVPRVTEAATPAPVATAAGEASPSASPSQTPTPTPPTAEEPPEKAMIGWDPMTCFIIGVFLLLAGIGGGFYLRERLGPPYPHP